MKSVRITKGMAEVAAWRIAQAQHEERIKKAKDKLNENTETIIENFVPAPLIHMARGVHTNPLLHKMLINTE